MKFEVGQMALVPIIMHPTPEIETLVQELVCIAKEDWDSFETSWDFKRHPLIKNKGLSFHGRVKFKTNN